MLGASLKEFELEVDGSDIDMTNGYVQSLFLKECSHFDLHRWYNFLSRLL